MNKLKPVGGDFMSANLKKNGKPFGFYVCSLGFSFERISFYTVKYMLAMWIAIKVSAGGLGMSTAEGAAVSGAFVAMTYITPMIGGWLADYWISPRLCVSIGMILMGVGYLFTWQANSMSMVWIMIAFVSIGTGLFKGNLSGINALLFTDEKELNEAFSIQYSFVNIGMFIGTTFIVLLIPVIGYNLVFLICAIMLFIDAFWFIINYRSLGDAGKYPFKVDQRKYESAGKKQQEDSSLTSGDKKRILAIVLVTLLSIVFWTVWYMAFMPVYYYFGYGAGPGFLERANWVIGNFKIPTAYVDSINALGCIIMGPLMGKFWTKMANRPKGDISMFKKTALGLLFVGLIYVIMVIADITGSGKASFLWFVLVGILLSVSEMVFSPLGNSFITRLAPAKLMGFLLGFWPLAVFFSTMLYPKIYALLETDIPQKFQVGYGGLGIAVILFGILLWFASKKLDHLETEE